MENMQLFLLERSAWSRAQKMCQTSSALIQCLIVDYVNTAILLYRIAGKLDGEFNYIPPTFCHDVIAIYHVRGQGLVATLSRTHS